MNDALVVYEAQALGNITALSNNQCNDENEEGQTMRRRSESVRGSRSPRLVLAQNSSSRPSGESSRIIERGSSIISTKPSICCLGVSLCRAEKKKGRDSFKTRAGCSIIRIVRSVILISIDAQT
jgi:hypothetical protein